MASYNVFAPFYDLLQTVDYPARAAYFDRLLRKFDMPDGLLLDLACGTGTLSVELAGRGYDVIGVDGSEQMLSVAQQKAWAAEQQILFLCQDMEELDLYGTVTGCVCALDSLNHLTEEEALSRAIGRVSLFLEPGGVFVFDMNTPYKQEILLADRSYVYEAGDTLCAWQNETEDGLTTILLDFFTRTKNGLYRRETEEFCERAYPEETVRRICAEHDLRICAVYADDTMESPTETSQRYIFVAKKGG
jgi:ubiquinone/menaquinone biosynthesis C-methylase UbiE